MSLQKRKSAGQNKKKTSARFCFLSKSILARIDEALWRNQRKRCKARPPREAFGAPPSGPGDVPWADTVSTRYTSATRAKKNKNCHNFFQKMQSRDDFCDIMCTAGVLCQIGRAERVESAAGRAPWSGQNLDSLYLHHTS